MTEQDEDEVYLHARIYGMYGLYLSGVVMYVAKLPERWITDSKYYVYSHNIWHLWVCDMICVCDVIHHLYHVLGGCSDVLSLQHMLDVV